jgi:hypothetical protein
MPNYKHRGCKGSNHQGTPSASSRRMVPPRHTSARGGTSSPPPNTVKNRGKDSALGRTSRIFPPPHKTDDPGRRAP